MWRNSFFLKKTIAKTEKIIILVLTPCLVGVVHASWLMLCRSLAKAGLFGEIVALEISR